MHFFFKISLFSRFLKSSDARAKIVVCIIIYLTKNGLTEYIFIRLFVMTNNSLLVRTSGLNVKLKNKIYGLLHFFSISNKNGFRRP